jgi:hypothetical protein
MTPTLIVAVLALLAWAVLVFASPIHAGAMHLLLALGTTLLVRWWALRT